MSKGFSIKCSVCGAIDSIVSIEVATHRFSVSAGAVDESGRPSIDFDGSSAKSSIQKLTTLNAVNVVSGIVKTACME